MITQGHVEAREKLAARLQWRAAGSGTGYSDAGSVREYADASSRALVARSRSSQGARHVNDEQVDVNHEAWTFLLDERDDTHERLIRLATEGDTESQAALDGATAVIESVSPGCWHSLGAVNVRNLRLSGSDSGALVLGVDYDEDLENGMVKPIVGGAVGSGEDLLATFDQPAIEVATSLSQQAPLNRCDFVIEEHNQFSRMWLRRSSFTGYLNVVEFPSQTGEFGVYRVKATADGPVDIQKRPPGDELDAPPVAIAGDSSSSSSRSSSSSASSYSSSSYSSKSSSSSSTAQSVTSSSSSTAQSNTSSSSAEPPSYSSSSTSLSSQSSSSHSSSSRSSASSSSSSTVADPSSQSSLEQSGFSSSSSNPSSSSSADDQYYRIIDIYQLGQGTGYAPGDQLTVAGGTAFQTALIVVRAVNENSEIVDFEVANQGRYSVTPENPATTTGGLGTGATWWITWQLVG